MARHLLSGAILASLSLLASGAAAAAAFTPGNLVVTRMGTGAAALGSAATPVFLEEYQPNGTLVQTISLPTTDSGLQQTCTNSGSSTSEGFITRSADGRFLTGACYDAAVGTASITTSTSATVNRVIYVVGIDGALDTATALTDAISGGNPRGAVSLNGSDLWITGTSSGGGIRYATAGATSSTALGGTPTNLRVPGIVDNQLYVSSASGSLRLGTVGTGLPTTAAQTITPLTGIPADATTGPYGYFFADLDATVAGMDTLYLANDTSGALQKYALIGTTWTLKNSVGASGDAFRGLTGSVSNGVVTLYVIRGTGTGSLQTLTDSTGYNVNLVAGVPTNIVTAPTNTAFRGVALVPVTPPALSIDDLSIAEGNATGAGACVGGTKSMSFTVNATSAPSNRLNFSFGTTDGSAVSTAGNPDFASVTSGTGSIAGGATSGLATVTVNCDDAVEADESFTVSLLAGVGYTLGDAQATGTLTNDDSAPSPELSINDLTLAEGSPGCAGGVTDFNFTVTATPAPGVGSDIGFTFTVGGGNATDGVDYNPPAQFTLPIVNPASTQTVTVQVGCDPFLEGNETFEVELVSATNATISATENIGTGTITNDDAEVSLGDATAVAEGNAGQALLQFPVTLTGVAPADIVVNVATGGTATAGVDYAAPAPTFTIPAGSAPGTVNYTVTVNGDTDIETDETVTVTFSNNPMIVDGNGTGTITEDDGAVAPSISVGDAVTVIEGNSGNASLQFPVTVTGTAQGDITVDVTLGGTAQSGSDYLAAGPTFTIPAASIPGTVNYTVTLNSDLEIEADETVTVTFSNPQNATIADGDGAGTIDNDDVGLSIADAGATETDATSATATFVVTLTEALGANLTVNATTADVTATGGSALPADYQAVAAQAFVINAGQTTVNVPVTVFGDLRDDDAETFTVTVQATGVVVTDATATGTITDNDGAALTIAQIQGTTNTSPVNNTTVTTVNNVVTAVVNNGFLMQSITPDADANTSEGLHVFTSTAPLVTGGGAIAVGDVLDIRGRVVEFASGGATNTDTEFSNVALVIVRMGSGQALPAAVALDPLVSKDFVIAAPCNGTGNFRSNFECFEHMRASVTQGTISGPNQTFGNDAVAEMWFAFGAERTFREVGIRDEAFGDPALTGIVLPRWDGNPEVVEIDMDRLGQANTILVPGSQFGVADGFMTTEFGGFEFWPRVPVNVTFNAPALPRPVVATPADEVSIGTINVENFFDTVQVAEAPNPAIDDDMTAAEFSAKMDDFVAYVCDVMKAPHVLGVVEIENQTVLDAMAAALNGRVGCLPAGSTYAASFGAAGAGTVEGNDPRYIDVGFLARSEVTVTAVTQLGKTTTTNECSGAPPCILHDRPPLLLEATFPVPNEAAMPFAVMVNHLRSLNGIEGPDTAGGVYTDANRIRRKRLDQAVDIATRVQAFNVANPGKPLVLTGDYNAFQFTDGYADLVNVIRGTANVTSDGVARDSQYEIASNIVNPPLSNAIDTLPAAEQYSYVFDGNAQAIDHALLNRAAQNRLAFFAYPHGNADAPDAIDTDPGVPVVRDFRLSDHDGSLLRLKLANIIFRDGFED